MTLQEAQDAIVAEFTACGDTFEKYQHLIELGKRLPALDPRYRSERYALPGCQSQVWMAVQAHDGRLEVMADADSLIIRGILALLLRVVNGQVASEVATCELYFLDSIGLRGSLSPARANGVATIVEYIQQSAAGR
jgi:cysteine desulfuration protein SufE